MKKKMIFSGQSFQFLSTSRLCVVKYGRLFQFLSMEKELILLLKFVNFMYSSGLGYGIKRVAERKATV